MKHTGLHTVWDLARILNRCLDYQARRPCSQNCNQYIFVRPRLWLFQLDRIQRKLARKDTLSYLLHCTLCKGSHRLHKSHMGPRTFNTLRQQGFHQFDMLKHMCCLTNRVSCLLRHRLCNCRPSFRNQSINFHTVHICCQCQNQTSIWDKHWDRGYHPTRNWSLRCTLCIFRRLQSNLCLHRWDTRERTFHKLYLKCR